MARVSARMSLGVPSSQHSPPLEWAGIVEEGVIGGFESRPRCNSRVIPQKYDGLLFALQLTQGQHDGACGGPVRPRGTWRHLRVHLTYVGTAGSANLPFRLWRSWRNGEGGSEDAGMTHSYNVDFDGHRELQKEPSQGKPSALSWTAPATSIQNALGRVWRTSVLGSGCGLSRDDHPSSQIRFTREWPVVAAVPQGPRPHDLSRRTWYSLPGRT